MIIFKKIIIGAVFGVTLTLTMANANLANANPANVERVTEGLITTGMAHELSGKCNNVNSRMLRGLSFLFGLKLHLQDIGYSKSEINAFVNDRFEKDRLEVIARERLASLGVRTNDAATYCTVALSQIANDTPVGRLLR